MICFENLDVKCLSEKQKKEIINETNKHNIIVFKKQKLSQKELANFAQIFGEIAMPFGTSNLPVKKDKDQRIITLSNVDAYDNLTNTCYVWSAYEDSKPRQTNSIFLWHSDKSYEINPARYTMLYAVDVPQKDGQTEIIDTSLCYKDLSQKIKQKYEKIYMIHDYAHMRKQLKEKDLTIEERKKIPPVIHPLINVNTFTNEKNIYFGMYCSSVVYKDNEESQKTIDSIYKFCTKKKYIYRHNWEIGDILIWNNFHTMHRACNNYDHKYFRRILERVVVR